ncbi:hypothetical protein BGZ63DRAFT_208659 [Mariannaea sp. PMI_226]|nr:hypothetical protein BGZ63DRAFT_208659 [Mariannaea sp. PMI_226]
MNESGTPSPSTSSILLRSTEYSSTVLEIIQHSTPREQPCFACPSVAICTASKPGWLAWLGWASWHRGTPSAWPGHPCSTRLVILKISSLISPQFLGHDVEHLTWLLIKASGLLEETICAEEIFFRSQSAHGPSRVGASVDGSSQGNGAKVSNHRRAVLPK